MKRTMIINDELQKIVDEQANAAAYAYAYADNADNERKNILKKCADICRMYLTEEILLNTNS